MTIDERYSAQFGAGPNHHLYGSVFTINKSSKMTTVQWDVDGDLAAIRSDVLRRCEVGSQSSITMVDIILTTDSKWFRPNFLSWVQDVVQLVFDLTYCTASQLLTLYNVHYNSCCLLTYI